MANVNRTDFVGGANAERAPAVIDAPDTLDTFLWQADPDNLRFEFVSGQAARILGADAERWLNDRAPWRSIARADRYRVELALRRAVRGALDDEVSFTATDAAGKTFPAKLIIRVGTSDGGGANLWGLLTDMSPGHRSVAVPAPRLTVPLVAPPMIKRATRVLSLAAALLFATYALAVSAHRPFASAPLAAVAIERVDQLEQVLENHAAEQQALENAVGSMEASVGELVALGPDASQGFSALEALRSKISALIALTPPDLAGRLRALLATIDRATPEEVTAPSPVSETSAPKAEVVAPAPKPEPDPDADPPASAPSDAPAPAPSSAPSAPGAPGAADL